MEALGSNPKRAPVSFFIHEHGLACEEQRDQSKTEQVLHHACGTPGISKDSTQIKVLLFKQWCIWGCKNLFTSVDTIKHAMLISSHQMSPHLKGLSISSDSFCSFSFFYLQFGPKHNQQKQLSNKDNRPLNILMYAYLLVKESGLVTFQFVSLSHMAAATSPFSLPVSSHLTSQHLHRNHSPGSDCSFASQDFHSSWANIVWSYVELKLFAITCSQIHNLSAGFECIL